MFVAIERGEEGERVLFADEKEPDWSLRVCMVDSCHWLTASVELEAICLRTAMPECSNRSSPLVSV